MARRRNQTPEHIDKRRISISNSWRIRRTRQQKDGGTITIRLSPSTLQQVIAAADKRAESTAAFVKNMVERKMLGLPE
jgi:hypothetical protein